jgi:hypothetical protein
MTSAAPGSTWSGGDSPITAQVSSVAPTGSSSTARFTRYASRCAIAQLSIECPMRVGPTAIPSRASHETGVRGRGGVPLASTASTSTAAAVPLTVAR